MKKTACLFPFVLLIMNLAAIHLFAANGIIPGSGTADDPYLIEDFKDFQTFSDDQNAEIYCALESHIKLMADIDLSPDLPGREVYSGPVINGYSCISEPNWITFPDYTIVVLPTDPTPVIIDDGIGSVDLGVDDFLGKLILQAPTNMFESVISDNQYQKCFYGVFDGNGYEITNLNFEATSFAYYIPSTGLFRKIAESGIVKNLTITNLNSTCTKNVAGGICGINKGRIDNCFVSGNMVSAFMNHSYGAIAGCNIGYISNSSVDINLLSYSLAGGICGTNVGYISSCSAQGIIRGTESIGGIAGSNGCPNSNKYYGIIENCYSEAALEDTSIDYWIALDETIPQRLNVNNYFTNMVGSITGANFDGSIVNCHGNYQISGNKWDVYGLSDEIYGCFWNSDAHEQVSLTTDDMWIGYDAMLTSATFINAGWDQSKWNIVDGQKPSLLYATYDAYSVSAIEISPFVENDVYISDIDLAVILQMADGSESVYSGCVTWEVINGNEYYSIENGKFIAKKDSMCAVDVLCQATAYIAGVPYSASAHFNIVPNIYKTILSVTEMDIYQYADQENNDSISFVINDLQVTDDYWPSFDIFKIDIKNVDMQSVPGYPKIYHLDRNMRTRLLKSDDGSVIYNNGDQTLYYQQNGLNLSGLTSPVCVSISFKSDSYSYRKNFVYAAFDQYTSYTMADQDEMIFRDVIEYHVDTPQAGYIDSDYEEIIIPEYIEGAYDLECSLPEYLTFGENPFSVKLKVRDSADIDVTNYIQWNQPESYWSIDSGSFINNNSNRVIRSEVIRGVYFDGSHEFYISTSVNLLPDYDNNEFKIKSANVSASRKRGKAKDKLELEISNFTYPIYDPQQDIPSGTIDSTFTFNLISGNGQQIAGFPKTIDYTKLIENGIVEDILFTNIPDIECEFLTRVNRLRYSVDLAINLKNLDMTGLSAPFTFEISDGDFYSSGIAHDRYSRVKDESGNIIDSYNDVINGRDLIPSILQKGISNAININRFKHKLKEENYKDSLSVSGTFVLENYDNFDPGYLKITYGPYEDICGITKQTKDKYYFKSSILTTVDDGGKEKQRRVVDVNAVFNIKTNKFIVKIKNANLQYSYLKSEFSFEFFDKDTVIVSDPNFTWVNISDYGENPYNEPIDLLN